MTSRSVSTRAESAEASTPALRFEQALAEVEQAARRMARLERRCKQSFAEGAEIALRRHQHQLQHVAESEEAAHASLECDGAAWDGAGEVPPRHGADDAAPSHGDGPHPPSPGEGRGSADRQLLLPDPGPSWPPPRVATSADRQNHFGDARTSPQGGGPGGAGNRPPDPGGNFEASTSGARTEGADKEPAGCIWGMLPGGGVQGAGGVPLVRRGRSPGKRRLSPGKRSRSPGKVQGLRQTGPVAAQASEQGRSQAAGERPEAQPQEGQQQFPPPAPLREDAFGGTGEGETQMMLSEWENDGGTGSSPPVGGGGTASPPQPQLAPPPQAPAASSLGTPAPPTRGASLLRFAAQAADASPGSERNVPMGPSGPGASLVPPHAGSRAVFTSGLLGLFDGAQHQAPRQRAVSPKDEAKAPNGVSYPGPPKSSLSSGSPLREQYRRAAALPAGRVRSDSGGSGRGGGGYTPPAAVGRAQRQVYRSPHHPPQTSGGGSHLSGGGSSATSRGQQMGWRV